MNQSNDRTLVGVTRPRPATSVTVVLLLCLVGLTGCGVVNAVRKVEHNITGNKATIDTFTSRFDASKGATFEVTYTSTGSSPTTILYAVEPLTGLTFVDTPSGASSSSVDLIVNSSGEYSCSPPAAPGSAPSCQKLGTADAASQNKIFDIYTPSHWTTFLQDFSLAAGLAGDKVTTSTMTVNGFDMQCVDFLAPGVPGTSTICTTAQGILGYVNVASTSTTFEIKSYSPSPPASLFQLPAGATITTVPPGTT